MSKPGQPRRAKKVEIEWNADPAQDEMDTEGEGDLVHHQRELRLNMVMQTTTSIRNKKPRAHAPHE